MKELVIIGQSAVGKTTLCNALLGWDVLPQSNDGCYMKTKKNDSRMLTEHIRLTDTPGYDFNWNKLPEDVLTAVKAADTVVVLLDDVVNDEPESLEDDPDWMESLAAQKNMLTTILNHAQTRDIVFAIPYEFEEMDEGLPVEETLQIAKQWFGDLSDRGTEAFFFVDPMKCLVAAIEDDHEVYEQFGAAALKAALVTE